MIYTRMLNVKTVYSYLDCTSGCHHIAPLPETQKKCDFMLSFGKFEFEKVSFGIGDTFGYLQDILIFSESNGKHLKYFRTVFYR